MLNSSFTPVDMALALKSRKYPQTQAKLWPQTPRDHIWPFENHFGHNRWFWRKSGKIPLFWVGFHWKLSKPAHGQECPSQLLILPWAACRGDSPWPRGPKSAVVFAMGSLKRRQPMAKGAQILSPLYVICPNLIWWVPRLNLLSSHMQEQASKLPLRELAWWKSLRRGRHYSGHYYVNSPFGNKLWKKEFNKFV